MKTLVVLAVCLAVTNARIQVGPKISPRFLGGRVVGGTDAQLSDAPYQISLRAQGSGGWSHICGGSLLKANKVITAAHCCDGFSASGLNVAWGGNQRTSLPYNSAVTTITKHPNWNTNTINNDYCVLTISTTASETNGVQFAKLATTRPADGAAATLTGWGRTSGSSSALPTTLQKADLNIISQTSCQSGWGSINSITTAMICAGHASRSGCNGDSGGPLVSGGQLVGIVSWGASGCPANTLTRPTVYASVAEGSSWLNSQ